MDLKSRFDGFTPDVHASEKVKPGRYNLQIVGDNEMQNDKGWAGCKIQFQLLPNKIPVGHLITIAHENPKYVQWGFEELEKLSKAAGFDSIVDDTSQLHGKVVSCSVKLNDGDYPELDSKFGNSFKPAIEEEKPVAKKEEKPSVSTEESDEIPF